MKKFTKIFIALSFCLCTVALCLFSVFSAESFMFEAEGVIDFVVLDGIDATISSATLSGVTKQSGSGEMQSFAITRNMQDSDIQALDGYKSWSGIKLAFTEESDGFAKLSFTVTNNSTKPIENVMVRLSTNITQSSPVWVAPSADFCVNYGESHTFEVDLIVQDPQQTATLENFNLTMEFDLVKPEDVLLISEYEEMGLTISPTTGFEAEIVSFTNTEIPTVVLPSVAKDENDKIYTISEIKDGDTVESGAFSAVSSTMTSITLPNTLTKIGVGAFNSCSALNGELDIPLSVEEIGESAFSGCRNLTGNLNLPPKLTLLDSDVFGFCENLTGVLKIPRGVVEI